MNTIIKNIGILLRSFEAIEFLICHWPRCRGRGLSAFHKKMNAMIVSNQIVCIYRSSDLEIRGCLAIKRVCQQGHQQNSSSKYLYH